MDLDTNEHTYNRIQNRIDPLEITNQKKNLRHVAIFFLGGGAQKKLGNQLALYVYVFFSFINDK